jgi:TolA-binding protein
MKYFSGFMLTGLIAALSCPIHAEDAKPASDISQYLAQLQLKLDHAAQRANQPTTAGSSVVGVRGSKADPLSKQLYWKGKEKPAAAAPEEVRMFRTAVEQARAGQVTEAIAALKTFQNQFPKSALKPDVDETLHVLTASAPAPAAPVAANTKPS